MESNKGTPIVTEYRPTEAEISLMQALANDLRPQEIANQKKGSRKTIEGQIASLKKKCGKKTIGGLVYLFYKNQLID